MAAPSYEYIWAHRQFGRIDLAGTLLAGGAFQRFFAEQHLHSRTDEQPLGGLDARVETNLLFELLKLPLDQGWVEWSGLPGVVRRSRRRLITSMTTSHPQIINSPGLVRAEEPHPVGALCLATDRALRSV